MTLLSFCTFPWWLSWLLPFLLGLALGWALWSKYKSMVSELESEVSNQRGTIVRLEGEIKNSIQKTSDLEHEITLARGKVREAEVALAKCLKEKGGNNTQASPFSKTESHALAQDKGQAAAESDSGEWGANAGKNIYAKLKVDNLQIIEGIGPKMEEVLKENKINNWSDLSKKSASDLRAILDKYGDKYKIIDVATWQKQAEFAATGNFEGLINMQKNIDGGNANTLSKSDSKLEKHLIKTGMIKAFVKDDLKAIEGIGPKISELLHDAGITSWSILANTSSKKLKKILDSAGSRFKLADPNSWPKQAQLASEGRFDDLQAFQDKLQGGKQ